MGWFHAILTDTSAHFVSPYPVKTDEAVEIAVTAPADAPISRIVLRTVEDGIDHYHPMVAGDESGDRKRFVARFTLRQAQIHYHFVVYDTTGAIGYLNRSGYSETYPLEAYDYTLDSAPEVPEWVGSAVFYQIFPDRFARSEKTTGVHDGEITRDGFSSRMMSWDDDPLPYSEAGSLDFFNGNLHGIIERLDHLESLGVNALYLNPIFTAKTNHRYDCLDYFSVDTHLGGDAALVALSQACHQREMKIILDVSINHIGIEHPWASGMELPDEERTVRVVAHDDEGNPLTWMGVPELLKLDYRVPELRNRVYRDDDSLVQRYLRPPFSIDGWRFDVASETGRYGTVQLGHEIWREIRSVIKSISPDAYIVGEHWQDPALYLSGDQWDSAMNYFGAGRPIRLWLGEQDRFSVHPQREGIPGRPIPGDQLGSLITQHFARLPGALVNAQFNLFDSHDVSRLHPLGLASFERYAGALALLFVLPGTPNIYYGDEIGVPGNLDGDHGKRFPMRWKPEEQDDRYLALYRSLARLKRGEPALHDGALHSLYAEEDALVLARVLPETALALVLNKASVERSLRFPRGPAAGTHAEELPLLGSRGRALDSDKKWVTVELPSECSRIVRLW